MKHWIFKSITKDLIEIKDYLEQSESDYKRLLDKDGIAELLKDDVDINLESSLYDTQEILEKCNYLINEFENDDL
jgi:hypothetical protein